MSLQTRLTSLVTAIGADIKALNTQINSGQFTVPGGPTLKSGRLKLAAGAAIPAGTPNDTLILRTSTGGSGSLSNPVLLVQGVSTTASTSFTTGSCTPPANTRVIIFIQSGLSGSAAAPTSVVHSGFGALTKINSVSISSGNAMLSAWTGVGNGTAGTFLITQGASHTTCAWQASSIDGGGSTPTLGGNDTLASGLATTTGATISPAPSGSSLVIAGMIYNVATTSTPTVGAGFAAIGVRQTGGNPVFQLWSEYDNSSPPAQAPWTIPTGNQHAHSAVEIKAPSASAGISLSLWDGTTELSVV